MEFWTKPRHLTRVGIVWVIMAAIVGGILIDIKIAEAYKVEVQEIIVVAEKKEVRIEVVYSKDSTEAEIRRTFAEEPNTAVAVAKAESGINLKADAYNPEWHYDKNGNKICQGSYGVFQIACVHEPENPKKLFDVQYNIKRAKEIRNGGTWKQWGGYSSGGWKKYL